MAKKAKDAGEITNGGSNVAAIKKSLKEASDRLLNLEQDKADIVAEMSSIKSEKVKPYMTVKAFMVAHQNRKLREGDIDDAETKAKEELDNIALANEALGNEQGDLFEKAAAAGVAQAESADAGLTVN